MNNIQLIIQAQNVTVNRSVVDVSYSWSVGLIYVRLQSIREFITSRWTHLHMILLSDTVTERMSFYSYFSSYLDLHASNIRVVYDIAMA